VEKTPTRYRKWVALRVLALSPHYFWGPPEAEAERNRRSRRQLAVDIVVPHLKGDDVVLDYGCGPGYMAAAVAGHAGRVDGVDVSDGALACARVLNSADNIRYLNVGASSFRRAEHPYDLAYSLALAQHIDDATLGEVLANLRRALKPGGKLLMHVVIDAPEWRSEEEWKQDKSAVARAKLRYALNCFTRSEQGVLAALAKSGFDDARIEAMADKTTVEDEVARQHLVTAISP
jgi:cyclopropane fatty-acyl-phospholipid synthase-like methyltransferase